MGRVWLTGRERRDQERRAPSRLDAAQYRGDEGAASTLQLRLRLVARSIHVRAGVLPLESVVLPEDVRTRHRLSEEQQGELVSRLRDCARQRAGGRRMLLAA